jgi:hypothetical protein
MVSGHQEGFGPSDNIQLSKGTATHTHIGTELTEAKAWEAGLGGGLAPDPTERFVQVGLSEELHTFERRL